MVSKRISLDLLTPGSTIPFFLPSSLFPSSSHSWCYCPPCCPKTLQSAGVLVQPYEEPCNFLPPGLFWMLCKSHSPLPLISGLHPPYFSFQQVAAIMVIFASGIDWPHSLLTRLWLPFSACICFSFLLYPFLPWLSSYQHFSVPQSIQAQCFTVLGDTVCPNLPQTLSSAWNITTSTLGKAAQPLPVWGPAIAFRKLFFSNHLPNLMANIVVKKATSQGLSSKPVPSHRCKWSWIKHVF